VRSRSACCLAIASSVRLIWSARAGSPAPAFKAASWLSSRTQIGFDDPAEFGVGEFAIGCRGGAAIGPDESPWACAAAGMSTMGISTAAAASKAACRRTLSPALMRVRTRSIISPRPSARPRIKRRNGDQSVDVPRHSASGWFSGRARSKAGSARQARSMPTILGNRSSGTFKRLALLTCGTRQTSAIVTSLPQQ
jgi:hypothetical protein